MPQTLGRLTAALAGLLFVVPMAYAAPGYQHFVVGNPADVVTTTTPLLVLQGGGTDVDENFVRMGAAAGGGDFVVIRASGTDAYNPYILGLCGCDSVETIVFKNHNAAFNAFVLERIRNAEALFIAGGDQSEYVRLLEEHTGGGRHQHVGQREEGSRRRHQRRHGHPERVPVLGHEQQQPHLGGGPGGPLPPRPDAGPRLPGAARGPRHDHGPAPAGARPHGPHRRRSWPDWCATDGRHRGWPSRPTARRRCTWTRDTGRRRCWPRPLTPRPSSTSCARPARPRCASPGFR